MEPKESQPPSFYGISASLSRALMSRKGLAGVRESKIRRLHREPARVRRKFGKLSLIYGKFLRNKYLWLLMPPEQHL